MIFAAFSWYPSQVDKHECGIITDIWRKPYAGTLPTSFPVGFLVKEGVICLRLSRILATRHTIRDTSPYQEGIEVFGGGGGGKCQRARPGTPQILDRSHRSASCWQVAAHTLAKARKNSRLAIATFRDKKLRPKAQYPWPEGTATCLGDSTNKQASEQTNEHRHNKQSCTLSCSVTLEKKGTLFGEYHF